MFGFNRLLNLFRPRGYVHIGGENFLDLRQFKKRSIVPQLFIVGAQKCGTSSLHSYLDQHPEIFMSKPLKEPGYHVPWPVIFDYYQKKNARFRSRSDLLKRGMLKGYRNERIIGESSTFYSNGTYNIKKKCWLDNRVDLESIRIIYLMKNPIERIVSHYLHALRYNNFKGDINSFVETNKEAIGISAYGKQIATYYDYLNADQILLLKFETMIKQPQQVLDQVYKFLDVAPFDHKDFRVYNAAPRSQQAAREAISWNPQTYQKIMKALTSDRQVLGDFADLEQFSWEYPSSIAIK